MFPKLTSTLTMTRSLQLLALVLVLALLWQLISGFLMLRRVESMADDLAVDHQAMTIPPPKSSSLAARLDAPFFGEYVPKNLSDANIQPSLLNVTIVGVIFSPKEDESQVIVSASGGQETVYQVGDALPGGAVVKRITAYEILVSRDGVLERLSLPKQELTFEPPPKPLIED